MQLAGGIPDPLVPNQDEKVPMRGYGISKLPERRKQFHKAGLDPKVKKILSK